MSEIMNSYFFKLFVSLQYLFKMKKKAITILMVSVLLGSILTISSNVVNVTSEESLQINQYINIHNG